MPSAERQHTATGKVRVNAVTPDQLERRAFAIEERGYNRDEVRRFLLEVAATLRLAQRSTLPPVLLALAGPAAGEASAGFDGEAATIERVSAEVANILRTAEISAVNRQDEAEALAKAILEQAERDGDGLRRQAATAAAADAESARRALIAAQQQARSIIGEAEHRAANMLEAARDHARHHARQIALEARQRAEEAAETEADTMRRLNEVRLEVVAAIEALSHSHAHSRGVIDLRAASASGAPPVASEPHSAVVPTNDASEHTQAATVPPATDAAASESRAERKASRVLIQRAIDRAALAGVAESSPALAELTGAPPSVRAASSVRPSINRRRASSGGSEGGAARPSPTAKAPAARAAAVRRPEPPTPAVD